VAGFGTVLTTTNGGVTWKAQYSSNTAPLLNVAFANAHDGWAVGKGGNILATTDGGATWTKQTSGTNGDLSGLAAASTGGAWAVGDSGTVLHTSGGSLVTTKLTLKLSGLKSGALKLGKRVTAKGTLRPTSLAGSKVTLTVQRKKGSQWRKVTNLTCTVSASGAYSKKYKPTKKGSYRLRATIAKTAAHPAAATNWSTFRVK